MLTEKFIERARELHDSRYSYDITESKIIAKDLVDVICHEHGKFKSRVHDHLYHSSGCPKCARISKSNEDGFVAAATLAHKEIYDYSKVKYINNYTPVEIVCKKHGSFKQQPMVHIKAVVGCTKCDIENRTKSQIVFIEEANDIHNHFYDYGSVKFVNTKSKVAIDCPLHGGFLQSPTNHLRGSGCPVCGNFKRIRTYNSNRDIREVKKTDKGVIYLAEFSDETEKFVKIGITTRNGINSRFGNTHRGYRIKKLFEKQILMKDATNIEQEIIIRFSDDTYIPIVKFGGYTECFVAGSKDKILNYIDERMN